jgi:hypothetical protein
MSDRIFPQCVWQDHTKLPDGTKCDGCGSKPFRGELPSTLISQSDTTTSSSTLTPHPPSILSSSQPSNISNPSFTMSSGQTYIPVQNDLFLGSAGQKLAAKNHEKKKTQLIASQAPGLQYLQANTNTNSLTNLADNRQVQQTQQTISESISASAPTRVRFSLMIQSGSSDDITTEKFYWDTVAGKVWVSSIINTELIESREVCIYITHLI